MPLSVLQNKHVWCNLPSCVSIATLKKSKKVAPIPQFPQVRAHVLQEPMNSLYQVLSLWLTLVSTLKTSINYFTNFSDTNKNKLSTITNTTAERYTLYFHLT